MSSSRVNNKKAELPSIVNDAAAHEATYETERKFAVSDLRVLSKLAQVRSLAGLRLAAAQAVTTHDTYLDTRDFSLLRQGLSLRVRRSQETFLVTLKALAGESQPTDGASSSPPLSSRVSSSNSAKTPQSSILTRLELEAPATGLVVPDRTSVDDLDWLPSEIRDYLAPRALLPKRLFPYLILKQERTKRVGRRKKDALHLELSLDQVQILPPESGRKAGYTANRNSVHEAEHNIGPIATFQEIELEMLSGVATGVPAGADAGKDVSTFASDASNEWLRRLDREPLLKDLPDLTESKLARGLRLWGQSSGEGSHPNERFSGLHRIHDALRQIWREMLVEIVLLEHQVRADQDVEAIHQTRVVLRKGRTAARFLGVGLKARMFEPLLKSMRRFARLLGAVRDFDVALLNLAAAPNEDAEQRKAREKIRLRRERARARAFERLSAWLDGKEHAKFIRKLAKFCATTPSQADLKASSQREPARTQVRHLFPALLMEQYTRVRVYETYLDPPGSISEEVLHALRIECKRLRYALECCLHLLPPRIERFLSRLRGMQELLGEINDASVETARVAKRKTEAERIQFDALQKKIAGLRKRFPKRLARLVNEKARRQFALAVAEI